jgi:hypothetical protein
VSDPPIDFHIVRLEVTAAAVIQDPSGQILGKNMVDATLSFGWRMAAPPAVVSDAAINAALGQQLSPVLALIQTVLTFNGWVAMGEVDEPMAQEGTTVGMGRSVPVRVIVQSPNEEAAVHD